MERIEEQAISAIRVLAAETVQKANSGHPGLPLGAATIGYTLFAKHLKYNPKNLNFFNRDRFVLSAGHGSALLYTLMHVFNLGITKEDLMGFRQLKTRTPGHPEYGHTPGVEVSTGPLGQGLANAVGFAVAEKMLAAKYNKSDLELVDHYTYVLLGDGCHQEGITNEAASLAGTWELNKLIAIYDSNNITIEGDTAISFTENVAKRYESLGWHVIVVNNGEDMDVISAAITLAKAEKKRPTMIEVKTKIGHGSELEGSAESHGSPLGDERIEKMKKKFEHNAKPFEMPTEVAKFYSELTQEFSKCETEWNKIAKAYKSKFPDEFEEFSAQIKNKSIDLKDEKALAKFADKPDATRNQSGIILNKIANLVPNLVGGSADLAPSTKTYLKDKGSFSSTNPTGRNFHFGIREHAMAAISNGIALHGGFINFCSTFFVFSDYMKGAMRMSALMNLPVIYVLTHDSIGVGEDGPTHQPIEQLVSLRTIPNMRVFRPADGVETAAAYVSALSAKAPTSIVLSRQNLSQLKNSSYEALNGGYIVDDSEKEVPDVILLASGSEVEQAIKAKEILKNQKLDVRVVSMPCMELFDKQNAKYKESILPSACRARVAIEAGSSMAWGKYVGLDGTTIGIDTFGASAPADQLFTIFGFTPENIALTAKKVRRNIQKAESATSEDI